MVLGFKFYRDYRIEENKMSEQNINEKKFRVHFFYRAKTESIKFNSNFNYEYSLYMADKSRPNMAVTGISK